MVAKTQCHRQRLQPYHYEGCGIMKKVLKIILETHKETDLTKICDSLQSTLIDLKHKHGEINGFEIRDFCAGANRRLREG